MFTCNKGHELIQHITWDCPICSAIDKIDCKHIDEINELNDEIDSLQDELSDQESAIEDLEAEIKELKAKLPNTEEEGITNEHQ